MGIFSARNHPKDLDELKTLLEKHGPAQAGEMIRKYALEGSLVSQIFMSNMYMIQLNGTPELKHSRDFALYTKLAAKNGDVQSQYNIAKYYINQIDINSGLFEEDIKFIRKAKYWHGKAAAAGFSPALDSLRNLECFEYEPLADE